MTRRFENIVAIFGGQSKPFAVITTWSRRMIKMTEKFFSDFTNIMPTFFPTWQPKEG